MNDATRLFQFSRRQSVAFARQQLTTNELVVAAKRELRA